MTLRLNDPDPLSTPVVQRNGRPARLICVDRKGCPPFSIVGLVHDELGLERIRAFTIAGQFTHNVEHINDLLNADPPPAEPAREDVGWLNIYDDEGRISAGRVHKTEKVARANAAVTEGFVATVRISWPLPSPTECRPAGDGAEAEWHWLTHYERNNLTVMHWSDGKWTFVGSDETFFSPVRVHELGWRYLKVARP